VRTSFLSLLLFSFISRGYSQSDTVSTRLNKTNSNYKSFVIVDETLFAINDTGQVIIWDLNKLDTIRCITSDVSNKYTAIAKDRNSQVFIGGQRGDIYKIDRSNYSCSLFLKEKYTVYNICFNSNNKMFLIVPNVVYDPYSKRHWDGFKNHASGLIYRKKVLGLFWKKSKGGFSIPENVYLDSKDRWWMYRNYGEFGTELNIFDAKNEKIYRGKLDSINKKILSPKSIFEDDSGNIYLTEGLQHMINFGKIFKIDSNEIITEIYENDYHNKESASSLFIGPGAYNKKEDTIYFTSDKGFYKAEINTNGKITDIKLVFNPTLYWKREPLAVGASMSTKQMEFTLGGKLVFLTENNGIGIYSNKNLVFLK